MKTGIMACQGSKCLFIDGDFDISPEPIRHYFSELEGCDLVVASKRHKLSRVNATRRRMFLSQSFNLFVRIATGVSVKDTQAGLKAGDSSALKKIFSLMSVSRYAFDVELLVIASKVGLKTKEMPVEITVRKAFRVKDILRMTYDVLGIAYRHRIYARIQNRLQTYGPTTTCRCLKIFQIRLVNENNKTNIVLIKLSNLNDNT